MTKDIDQALRCETDFLAGVESNFAVAKGKFFRGSLWHLAREDESDRLRALMAANRNLDGELLKSLPCNRRVELHGFERRWFWGKRPTGVAVASVISSLEHYARREGGPAPPIGLGELVEHVRKLVSGRRVAHVVGVCSPSGFTDDARSARVDLPDVTVVLIEPDETGGWKTTSATEGVDARVLKIFDPESTNRKVERVRKVLEERSADLLTGGLSVSSVARQVNLPPTLVREAFEQVAESDPELKLMRQEGEFLLYRGVAGARESRYMGVIDRIRQLFAREGNEAEKINVLGARRAALAIRRDRIYEDIGKLEKKEAQLLAEGKAATSAVPRRRLAAQLAQLRKDIARQNTTAAMLNQQINVISTDIHNLTLLQQGEMAKLPDTEELTRNAVAAEEMLESLKANNELVGSLAAGMEEISTSEEELAILREFEEADEEKEEKAPQPSGPVAARPLREREKSSPIAENADEEEEASFDEPAPPSGRNTRRDADVEPL